MRRAPPQYDAPPRPSDPNSFSITASTLITPAKFPPSFWRAAPRPGPGARYPWPSRRLGQGRDPGTAGLADAVRQNRSAAETAPRRKPLRGESALQSSGSAHGPDRRRSADPRCTIGPRCTTSPALTWIPGATLVPSHRWAAPSAAQWRRCRWRARLHGGCRGSAAVPHPARIRPARSRCASVRPARRVAAAPGSTALMPLLTLPPPSHTSA
jgi:hypothetical protein